MSEERARYGDSRRSWDRDFVDYMYDIVEHPHYAGMPCTKDDNGKIDWTIPSNRAKGSKNWNGNARRRQWWRNKAEGLGIPVRGRWLSKTAKKIHPTGRKPCQICGRIMELAYVYPTQRSIQKLNYHLPPDEQLAFHEFLTIYEIVDHLFTILGSQPAKAVLSDFLKQDIADEATLDDVKEIIRQEFVDKESRLCSPGSMSNAPDRLDGFHTYNLCCRSRQDTGRSTDNLRTYGDDRRAFEHWCEGDWVAANLLMVLAGKGACSSPACTNRGQLTADHVGPISLGFAHSPHFVTVCPACNSAKNNRMSLRDVELLLERESRGEQVVSWQTKPLWDRCKHLVRSDADALLLSKLLRILQHHYIVHLYELLEADAPDALLQLLSPEQALTKVEFIGLDPTTLKFDKIVLTKRNDTYAHSKAARMIRIAYDALADYAGKGKRNVQSVESLHVADALKRFRYSIERAVSEPSTLRADLIAILQSKDNAELRAAELRRVLAGRYMPDVGYGYVRVSLGDLICAYAEVLADRFKRGDAIAGQDVSLFNPVEIRSK